MSWIDISATAVRKANAKYPDIRFEVLEASQFASIYRSFDLVVVKEVLSCLKNWRETLDVIASMTRYIYATLYLPADPVEFVGSFDDLRGQISKSFTIDTEVLVNQENICVLAKTRS